MMDANGTHRRRVYHQASPQPERPEWSPDGKYLAFDGEPGIWSTAGIYLMDANGRHLHRLHDKSLYPIADTNFSAPAWQPIS